jgi:DNA-directed RNA polymerase specialized sigma24 family protein
LLRDIEQLDTAETADMLDVTVGVVKPGYTEQG